MRLVEKQWIVGDWIGLRPAYSDVEPELLEFEPGIRVLPARFYFDKSQLVTLVKRYEPGEHPQMKDGGFHCRWKGGNCYFELDAVIIHPQIITLRKKRIKWDKRDEKKRAEKEKTLKRIVDNQNGIRRRGRPALDPAVKQQRVAAAVERTKISGGKRGRPRKGEVREPKVYIPLGTKRGRPSLSDEEKQQRIQQREKQHAASGGKRGRPADPSKRAQREEIARLTLERNPEKKRGRPSSKR